MRFMPTQLFPIKLLLFLTAFVLFQKASAGQETKIMGTVTDQKTGEFLPFVNIIFKGTTIGITTGFDGTFSIETKNPGDSLVASFVGYKKQTKPVSKGRFQYINYEMIQDNYELETVVIKAGENPAEILLRKIIQNKKLNDPDKYDAYEYEVYNKIEIDANNITDKFKERRIFREFDFIFDNVDTSTVNGKTYLPIFLSESISNVYSKRNPKASIEIVKANKISGIENESVMQFLGDKFQHTNLYDNYINLFQKNFISPIANFGLNFYKYYLVDSTYFGQKWCYKIMFKPRQKQTLTFTGSFWVHDTSFAIKEVEMKIVDDANLNFVNDLVIQKEFNLIDGKYWLLTKDYIIGDLNIVEDDKSKVVGFFGRKTTTYKNFIINQPKEDDFYKSPVSVVIDETADEFPDEFWAENRHEELTRDEKTIYYMVDTLKKIPKFNTYIDIIEMITTGYYETGKFEIGPYGSILSFNAIEGVRIRLGGRTSNSFSKKLMLFGHSAYGTLDKRWKYGGGFMYMLHKNPRRSFGFDFQYDLEQLGASQNAFREDFFLAFLFRRNPTDKLSTVEGYKFYYEHEWFNGFSNTINLIHRNLYPIGNSFKVIVEDEAGRHEVNESAITSTELCLDTRLAYKERFLMGEFERISLGAKFPILTIRYGYGIPRLLGGDNEFHRIQIGLSHWFNVFNLGWSKYIIESGRIWGKIPYPLLKLHEGNETYFFDEYSFNMMNYFEFVSDKYLSVYYTHHFDGYFFNRIPLFRKLKWREVAFAKGLIGGLDNINRNYSVFPQGMYTLSKPYFEAGAGVENIFKIIRVDAIWRLSHLDHPNISKFGIRLSLQFNF